MSNATANTVIHRAPREVPSMPPKYLMDQEGIDPSKMHDVLLNMLLIDSPVDYVKDQLYTDLPSTMRKNEEYDTWSILHNNHIVWFKEQEHEGETVYRCMRVRVSFRLTKGITFRLAEALGLDPMSDVYHKTFNAVYALIHKKP